MINKVESYKNKYGTEIYKCYYCESDNLFIRVRRTEDIIYRQDIRSEFPDSFPNFGYSSNAPKEDKVTKTELIEFTCADCGHNLKHRYPELFNKIKDKL